MDKKMVRILSIIAVVAVVVVGGTFAYVKYNNAQAEKAHTALINKKIASIDKKYDDLEKDKKSSNFETIKLLKTDLAKYSKTKDTDSKVKKIYTERIEKLVSKEKQVNNKSITSVTVDSKELGKLKIAEIQTKVNALDVLSNKVKTETPDVYTKKASESTITAITDQVKIYQTRIKVLQAAEAKAKAVAAAKAAQVAKAQAAQQAAATQASGYSGGSSNYNGGSSSYNSGSNNSGSSSSNGAAYTEKHWTKNEQGDISHETWSSNDGKHWNVYSDEHQKDIGGFTFD